MTISRRRFLAGSAGVAAAGALGRFAPTPALARERAFRQALDRSLRSAVAPQGTTLSGTIVPIGPGPYRHLVDGPGEPTMVRADLGTARTGREDARVPLASFVHFTDQHLVDAQSPGRVEFIDVADPLFGGAFRPQELLTTQVATSMVERVNQLGRGPVTGRGFDAVVCTGDNIDNQQLNELQWLVTILDGGRVVPDSGALGTYQGIQDALDAHPFIWHPDPGLADDFKSTKGYPDLPGLLERSIAPFMSPGLRAPWYSVYGNHDCNIQGNAGRTDALDQIFVGDLKPSDLAPGVNPFAFIIEVMFDSPTLLTKLRNGQIPAREVTPDASRRTATIDDWITAHLGSPTGTHGYHPDDIAADRLYYEFEIAPGVFGLSLDTTNHAGGLAGADGSIGEGQLAWLEERLAAHSSRHYAPDGTVVTHGTTDHVVLAFSHHTSGTMGATDADPHHPGERRIQGAELVSVLVRYPNLVAWVDGHTHTNEVVAHPDPAGLAPGFWEISTASHVDWPQQARIIEIADNRDGTISLFGTMIEHLGPAVFDPTAADVTNLAGLSRELGLNDGSPGRSGGASDRNVELLRSAPWIDLTPTTTSTSTTPGSEPTPTSSVSSTTAPTTSPSPTTSTSAPNTTVVPSSTTAPPSAPAGPGSTGGTGVAPAPPGVPVGASPGYTG